MSREKKEKRRADKFLNLDNGVALATQNTVQTMVGKNMKTNELKEFKYRSLLSSWDEPNLTPEQPLFVIKSGLNGGGSVKILPIRFFISKGEKPQTIIQCYLQKGIIKINDKLRLFDEGNYHSERVVFVESIKVNNLFVDSVSFDPQKTREGNIIEISILDKDLKVFSYDELINFNNWMTRPL